MRTPINFDDLFNRVSGNTEFAHKMLTSFFETWSDRLQILNDLLSDQNYNALADSSHQLKGIMGNLSLEKGFRILKSVHEEARLKNPDKLKKLIRSLEKEVAAGEKYFKENQHRF